MAHARTRTTTTVIREPIRPRQLPGIIRLTWFLVIGWWLGTLWALACLTFTILGGFLAWPIMSKLWSAVPGLLWLERR